MTHNKYIISNDIYAPEVNKIRHRAQEYHFYSILKIQKSHDIYRFQNNISTALLHIDGCLANLNAVFSNNINKSTQDKLHALAHKRFHLESTLEHIDFSVYLIENEYMLLRSYRNEDVVSELQKIHAETCSTLQKARNKTAQTLTETIEQLDHLTQIIVTSHLSERINAALYYSKKNEIRGALNNSALYVEEEWLLFNNAIVEGRLTDAIYHRSKIRNIIQFTKRLYQTTASLNGWSSDFDEKMEFMYSRLIESFERAHNTNKEFISIDLQRDGIPFETPPLSSPLPLTDSIYSPLDSPTRINGHCITSAEGNLIIRETDFEQSNSCNHYKYLHALSKDDETLTVTKLGETCHGFVVEKAHPRERGATLCTYYEIPSALSIQEYLPNQLDNTTIQTLSYPNESPPLPSTIELLDGIIKHSDSSFNIDLFTSLKKFQSDLDGFLKTEDIPHSHRTPLKQIETETRYFTDYIKNQAHKINDLNDKIVSAKAEYNTSINSLANRPTLQNERIVFSRSALETQEANLEQLSTEIINNAVSNAPSDILARNNISNPRELQNASDAMISEGLLSEELTNEITNSTQEEWDNIYEIISTFGTVAADFGLAVAKVITSNTSTLNQLRLVSRASIAISLLSPSGLGNPEASLSYQRAQKNELRNAVKQLLRVMIVNSLESEILEAQREIRDINDKYEAAYREYEIIRNRSDSMYHDLTTSEQEQLDRELNRALDAFSQAEQNLHRRDELDEILESLWRNMEVFR